MNNMSVPRSSHEPYSTKTPINFQRKYYILPSSTAAKLVNETPVSANKTPRATDPESYRSRVTTSTHVHPHCMQRIHYGSFLTTASSSQLILIAPSCSFFYQTIQLPDIPARFRSRGRTRMNTRRISSPAPLPPLDGCSGSPAS
jgi:hypothetical protein